MKLKKLIIYTCLIFFYVAPLSAKTNEVGGRVYILAQPGKITSRTCNARYGRSPAPVVAMDFPNRYTGAKPSRTSGMLDRSNMYFMNIGAAAFVLRNAKTQLRKDLLAWVDASAVQMRGRRWVPSGSESDSAAFYFTLVTLFPMVVSYGHHKD
ncbi:hypothetical protein [Profundibacter sp.]